MARLQNVRRNAVGNSLRRLMDRIARQVGVTGRRLDVAVPQQLANHRQGLAERKRTGREGMTEVVQVRKPATGVTGRQPRGWPCRSIWTGPCVCWMTVSSAGSRRP